MQIPLAEPHPQREPMFLHAPVPSECDSIAVEAGAIIEFGRFRILLRRRALLAGGLPVRLGTRAFDVLMVLIEADGALVTKDELMARAWPGVVVAPDNLKVQISELRRVLAPDGGLIRTEFGRGYRFTGAIRRSTIAETERSPAPKAIESSIGSEAASSTDVTVIATRLTALEVKLSETLAIFAGRSHHPIHGFYLDSHRTDLAARPRRSRRCIEAASRVGQTPRKMADWAAGG
jgi:DNA-binding winged helix-turn-helix (wHTH) protein